MSEYGPKKDMTPFFVDLFTDKFGLGIYTRSQVKYSSRLNVFKVRGRDLETEKLQTAILKIKDGKRVETSIDVEKWNETHKNEERDSSVIDYSKPYKEFEKKILKKVYSQFDKNH